MKKSLLLFSLLFILPFYLFSFLTLVYAVDPHLELSPSSGVITSSGTSIEVAVDTGGLAAKSAKAVINFDSTLLEVSSVVAGDFFDDVSYNIYNSNGQVVINANLSLDSMLESKTGTGDLATMTVKAKTTSGTGTMTFDCTEGSSTDSNVNNPTPLDIIVCASNINGSYDLSGATPSASATSAVGGDATSTSSATTTTVPVTGVSTPTILLLISGLFLIFTPILSKIRVNG